MDRTNTQERFGRLKEPIFICAGEPSGDLYAGLITKKLKKKNPDLKIYGVGGGEMRKSGVEVVLDYQFLMTFGFTQGLGSLFRNYRIYQQIARILHRVRPQTYIAVAYPGINLLLCRYAKKLGCQVLYFLPPQIWAWGDFRKYFIKKWVDQVISVFPFEYEYYRKRVINTAFLENPLIDGLKAYKRSDFEKRIGFMPGSRPSQIKRNLPVMIELARRTSKNKDTIEFDLILSLSALASAEGVIARNEIPLRQAQDSSPVIAIPSTAREKQSQDKLGTGSAISGDCHAPRLHAGLAMTKTNSPIHPVPLFKIITEDRYQAMKNCDLLIISAGTASFEAAIMNIPQIFFNRPSFFDYYFFRRFLKVKEYNLTNLVFNKKFVPSFVAYQQNYLLQNLSTHIERYFK